MALPDSINLAGTRASQPAAGPENSGCYYRVTDEGDNLEQSDGAAWVSVAAGKVLAADPATPSDDTWWIRASGVTPTLVIDLRVRIAGVTYTLRTVTV